MNLHNPSKLSMLLYIHFFFLHTTRNIIFTFSKENKYIKNLAQPIGSIRYSSSLKQCRKKGLLLMLESSFPIHYLTP